MVLVEQNQLGLQNYHDLLMNKYLFIFLSLILCQNCLAVPVIVKKIIDGDTFVGDVKFSEQAEVKSVKIRLNNVDTPELNGQCADEIKQAKYAKQRLGELIPVGSEIEIKNIKNDKYTGRIDASVFDSANRNVGSVLIKEKIGRSYSGGKRLPWCN